ncbi:hypothetical protein QCN36_gp24 [Arthrobacter phage CastorTray]|uniref:Minor tail protein n=1 Tax=Arthrobacter phage CastorTray TaxID=2859632 RepID=A0AAE8BDK1_9CAUD|nr:hypothetical protein QCN36_gp24 [Arthrobacter phage CastorTray]QYC55012.1 hypothetical protein SEA_CASTORTRAY_24 [Arthrobacter phage CastorTray]
MVNQPDDPNQAQAWISGTPPDQTIDFYIPRGNTGPRGPIGPIGPSLAVGSVATVTGPAAPGTVGPKGDTGLKGDPGGLVNPALLSAGTDWNNIITSGLYYAAGADMTGMPNSAPSMAIGTNLMVQARNASVVTQIAWTVSNAPSQVQFQRSLVSGTWGSWRAYRNTVIDNSAGKVVYLWDETANRSQLVYGDTGVRTLTLDNGYLGTLQIRRVGHQVYLNGAIKRPPGGTINGTFLVSVPDGFKPQSVAWTFFPVRHSPTPNWGTLYRKAYELVLEGLTGDTDAGEARFEISWTTVQPWPTALPGTASGAVPNV